MANKTPKSCAECVQAHQGGTQTYGTRNHKHKIMVNHPACACCMWARAVTGRGQLVDCVEYCNCTK